MSQCFIIQREDNGKRSEIQWIKKFLIEVENVGDTQNIV